MATKTVVSLVDDLTGDAAEETVEFGLDGVTYEIDLAAANAAALRETLGTYLPRARRVAGRRRTGRGGPSASAPSSARPTGRAPVDREQSRAIREWARRQGMTVSDRGRISAEITAAYQKAH
jgi:hypothetical protein